MYKILIIEDDKYLAELLRSFFELRGCLAAVMDLGKNGLKWIEEIGKPDLILLDVGLPDMDGLEICRLVKEYRQRKKVAVIVMTGMQDEKLREKALSEYKADLYVKKPFDLNQFYAQAKEIMDRYEKESLL